MLSRFDVSMTPDVESKLLHKARETAKYLQQLPSGAITDPAGGSTAEVKKGIGFCEYEETSGAVTMHSWVTIKSTLREAFEVMYCFDTPSVKHKMSQIFGPEFLEGSMLYHRSVPWYESLWYNDGESHLAAEGSRGSRASRSGESNARDTSKTRSMGGGRMSRSKDRESFRRRSSRTGSETIPEFLSVVWAAFRGSGMFDSDRDYCLMDYLTEVPAESTRDRVPRVVRVLQSTDLTGCKPLQAWHKYDRGQITRCGYVFRPATDVMMVDFYVTMQRSLTRNTSCKKYRKQVRRMAEALGNLQDAIITLRISAQPLVKRELWIDDSERVGCCLCLRVFGTLRRKHHCRLCGEVVCARCSMFKMAEIPVLGLRSIRVCKNCVVASKDNVVPDGSSIRMSGLLKHRHSTGGGMGASSSRSASRPSSGSAAGLSSAKTQRGGSRRRFSGRSRKTITGDESDSRQSASSEDVQRVRHSTPPPPSTEEDRDPTSASTSERSFVLRNSAALIRTLKSSRRRRSTSLESSEHSLGRHSAQEPLHSSCSTTTTASCSSSSYGYSPQGAAFANLEHIAHPGPRRSSLSALPSLGSFSVPFSSFSSASSNIFDKLFRHSAAETQVSLAQSSVPQDEQARLSKLTSLHMLSGLKVDYLTEICRLSARVVGTSTAAISLMGRDRQMFVARTGMAVTQVPRRLSFCTYTITRAEPFVVLDARQDRRFTRNPLVTSLHVRFYVGIPLRTSDGVCIGTLCVFDQKARYKLAKDKVRVLETLAKVATVFMERREVVAHQQFSLSDLRALTDGQDLGEPLGHHDSEQAIRKSLKPLRRASSTNESRKRREAKVECVKSRRSSGAHRASKSRDRAAKEAPERRGLVNKDGERYTYEELQKESASFISIGEQSDTSVAARSTESHSVSYKVDISVDEDVIELPDRQWSSRGHAAYNNNESRQLPGRKQGQGDDFRHKKTHHLRHQLENLLHQAYETSKIVDDQMDLNRASGRSDRQAPIMA